MRIIQGTTTLIEVIEKQLTNILIYDRKQEKDILNESIIIALERLNICLEAGNPGPQRKYWFKDGKAIFDILPDHTILTAINAYEAMEFISGELPIIILVNDSLPLLNGEELIKRVRARDKNFSVGVFVFTDNKIEDVEKKYNPFIIDGIYKNSINNDELVKEIKKKFK